MYNILIGFYIGMIIVHWVLFYAENKRVKAKSTSLEFIIGLLWPLCFVGMIFVGYYHTFFEEENSK